VFIYAAPLIWISGMREGNDAGEPSCGVRFPFLAFEVIESAGLAFDLAGAVALWAATIGRREAFRAVVTSAMIAEVAAAFEAGGAVGEAGVAVGAHD
jgi:hypothetical protein